MTGPGIPVLAARHLDPGCGRIEMTLPEGMTVDQIVRAALPGGTSADLRRVRVALVSGRGSQIILPGLWRQVRPRPGVRVVIRVIAGRDALRAILSIVVAIAAVALGAMFGPALGAMLGISSTTAGALVAMGANLLGSLLINALIPPARPDDERRQGYSITGWRNRLDPDGAVPVVLGQLRYAPPFAASTWTEIVGDWQRVHAMLNFGVGPVEISDIWIGDTPIEEYDEFEIEIRNGLPSDAPSSLYHRQIVEENIGVELTRPLVRDDEGNPVSGEPAEETPVTRTTGADATSASVILAFPAGLIRFDDRGRKRQHSVRVRIEQRHVAAEDWDTVATLDIAAQKTESFYRQHSWNLPVRGRYQVRLTMLTDETDDSKVQQRVAWAALQTVRPEYPLDYPHPLALVVMRIKATHQLTGALDNISAMVRRVCLDWDHETRTWTLRATSNPASLYRHVLQCPANPRPVPDSEIDLDLLADWHDFCRLKGLHYNRVQDQPGTTLRDVLVEVAAAGRAAPRHDGLRWGVVIDRPAELVVDHVNPRNSWSFSVTRAYAEKPHAWIIRFQDQDNDFKEARRIVRRPGYEGDITLTEVLDLPGVTDPDIVWREGTRRFLEAEHRPDVFEVTQEGAVRVATRGDTIAATSDMLSRTQWAGRVRDVIGHLLEIDEEVTMLEGQAYAVRFRVFADAEDTIGTSVVRPVATAPGATSLLSLTGSGPMPAPRDIVHFGLAGSESHMLVVTHVETTEDQCSVLRAVAAAPIIDALVDAAEIPPWSSRVGEEVEIEALQPAAPRFSSITSGLAGTDEAGLIVYAIEPGAGQITAGSFRIGHRLAADTDWTDALIPAANGGGQIDAYDQGDPVTMRAQAVSHAGVPGPWSLPVTITVGAGDAALPPALDPEAVSVTTLLGGALIMLATGEDAATTQVQVYRSMSPDLNRATDAVGAPHPVAPLSSISIALGDTTRSNLVSGGAMDSPDAWTMDPGWEVDGGVATHTPGAAGAIGQPVPAEAGRWYRIGYTVSDRTAGTLTPRLTGGSLRAGTTVSANGSHSDRIQAVSGNDTVEWLASAAFDGALDDAVAYLETAACLAQGTHYLWLEPQNEDGVPGPVSGPITIAIT